MTDTKKVSIQEEFDKQLADFINDKSEQDEYKNFNPLQEKVIVKLFKFAPIDNKNALGTSQILIESPLDGKWKSSSIAQNEKIFPICKVIKVGKYITDIKAGDVFTVPVSDIVGDDMNPEFMWLVQNFGQQGKHGSMTKIPENMRQRIPKLEKNWERYKFSLPDRIGDETDDDKLVYLIPLLKLEAEYNPFE